MSGPIGSPAVRTLSEAREGAQISESADHKSRERSSHVGKLTDGGLGKPIADFQVGWPKNT